MIAAQTIWSWEPSQLVGNLEAIAVAAQGGDHRAADVREGRSGCESPSKRCHGDVESLG
ncbi:hypothetical protein GORHZ_008_00020 [Gordonia rhizosphera NBRC 16068]|uniref:Uncharacterized protein n=1 Tax=Gordonia rhizosphera NBRC 16068 TaxID=1108045 RepID=K6UXR1_9ACTN|nr:hypothetical protein GORHZ_008_00020 [Gordonia rhizosphera NBRC 16068]